MEQVENGHSLEAQSRRLHAYADGTERKLSEVYTDAGVSAGSLKRPELQRLLAAVRANEIASVYVSKLDRLSRNLADL
jgi:site-specific DNA recombinase